MAVRRKGQFKGARTRNRRPPAYFKIDGLDQTVPGFALNLQSMNAKLLDFSGIGGDDIERPSILKVQRPLASNAEAPFCLVYNRTRSITYHVPFDATLIKIFSDAGNPAKLYMEARLLKDEQAKSYKFQISKIVEAQPW